MALPAFLAGAFQFMSKALPAAGRAGMGFAGFGGLGGAAMKRTAAGAAANTWPTTLGTPGMADQAAKAGASLGQLRAASLKTALALYAVPKSIELISRMRIAGSEGAMRFSGVGMQSIAQLEINRLRREIGFARGTGASFAFATRGMDALESGMQEWKKAGANLANITQGLATRFVGALAEALDFIPEAINKGVEAVVPAPQMGDFPVFDFLHRLGQESMQNAIERRVPEVRTYFHVPNTSTPRVPVTRWW